MGVISIDRERSTGCGGCEAVCPARAIAAVEGGVAAHAPMLGSPKYRPSRIPGRKPLDPVWR